MYSALLENRSRVLPIVDVHVEITDVSFSLI